MAQEQTQSSSAVEPGPTRSALSCSESKPERPSHETTDEDEIVSETDRPILAKSARLRAPITVQKSCNMVNNAVLSSDSPRVSPVSMVVGLHPETKSPGVAISSAKSGADDEKNLAGGARLVDADSGKDPSLTVARNEDSSREETSNDADSLRNSRPTTLEDLLREALAWLRKKFPTVMVVAAYLPFALVPFALSMLVLVQGLVTKGWVPVFAHGWDHWVNSTGTAGAIGGMGFLSVVLCNVSSQLEH